MDELDKFKFDFFDVAIKDIIDNMELSSDKNVPDIYGWFYRPIAVEMRQEITPFEFLIDRISLIKDGKRYVAEKDDYILFDDFYYYVFWKKEDNLKLKDGIYYQNHLIIDKLTSLKTRTSKLNLKKILDDWNKEHGIDED